MTNTERLVALSMTRNLTPADIAEEHVRSERVRRMSRRVSETLELGAAFMGDASCACCGYAFLASELVDDGETGMVCAECLEDAMTDACERKPVQVSL